MEEEEIFIPTEPVPLEPGSGMTYEQGERLIEALEGIQGDIESNHTATSESLSTISTILESIKTNTTPDTSVFEGNPSGVAMTFEQGNEIIRLLNDIGEAGFIAGMFVLGWFVIKWLYRYIGGLLFGGV